jgi:hypothetical protein
VYLHDNSELSRAAYSEEPQNSRLGFNWKSVKGYKHFPQLLPPLLPVDNFDARNNFIPKEQNMGHLKIMLLVATALYCQHCA